MGINVRNYFSETFEKRNGLTSKPLKRIVQQYFQFYYSTNKLFLRQIYN